MDRLTSLGQTVATPGALAALVDAGQTPRTYLGRHISGDYGDMPPEDKAANRADLAAGLGRVFSAYTLPTGVKIWVITNLLDSAAYDTCILLPTEY